MAKGVISIAFYRDERTAQERWDAEHMRTLATKLPTEKADAFRETCEGYALTRYEALRRFCLTVVSNPAILTTLDIGR